MNSSVAMPSREEFLAGSVEAVAAVAPRSMVYAPGGTRRSAAFAGIEPWSAEYLRRGQDGIAECLKVIFRYGVEHVFMPMIMVGHANEVEDIEQQLMIPMSRYVTDPHLLEICREHGWRMRIASSAYQDLLQPYIKLLEESTPRDAKHTWWMTFTPSVESWWLELMRLASSKQISTRTDAIRALYGEDISPITLCISFGKLTISPDLFPPILMDNVQCYWSQQAGTSLTDLQFRKVLYDYAYLRKTWQKDKTTRAREGQLHQRTWEAELILGLGKRLGPFWYPELPESPT